MVEQARAFRTRHKILMAAAEAINEPSYERAVGAIVKRAGLTAGAVYYHFANREALVRAVIEAQHAASHRKACALLEAGYPALEVMLRASAGLTLDIINDPLTRAGIRLTTEFHLLETPPRQSWDDWIEFHRMLLAQARDDHDLAAGIKPVESAQIITGCIAGMYVLSSLLEDMAGLSHRVCTLWQLFITAQAAPGAASHWVERAAEIFAQAPTETASASDLAPDPT